MADRPSSMVRRPLLQVCLPPSSRAQKLEHGARNACTTHDGTRHLLLANIDPARPRLLFRAQGVRALPECWTKVYILRCCCPSPRDAISIPRLVERRQKRRGELPLVGRRPYDNAGVIL
eukprot:scaffold95681_cov31-Tisochrysis_lutea.AAC.1